MPTEKSLEDVDLDKEIFTTFDAAAICRANVTSIKNWIEQGELEAHRTPGGHFRIQREELESFLDRHGMPNPFAANRPSRIFALLREPHLAGRLQSEFGEDVPYESSAELLEALLKIGRMQPDVLVVDDRLERAETEELIRVIERVEALHPHRLIVIHERDPAEMESLREAGADRLVDVRGGAAGLINVVREELD